MKFIILATFIVLAVVAQDTADKKATYPAPAEYPPQPYSFDWSVKDEPSKNDYAHNEKSDGKVTTGSYRVVLPDGRTQIVTYTADENGYVADVKYDGEAKYPEASEYKPAGKTDSI